MYFHSVHQRSLEDVQTLSRSRWQAIEFIFVFSFQKTHTPTQTVTFGSLKPVLILAL